MTPPTDEQIRWSWTILTGCGVLFALYNLREVLIDNWAVSQTRRGPVNVLRLQTRAEVWNQSLILVALAGHFLAGAFALAGVSVGALVSLIVSAAALIILSFTQGHGRREIFSAIRVRRESKKEKEA